MRRPLALGFAAASALVATAFFLLSSACGILSYGAATPGAPLGEPECVPSTNILALLLVAGAAAGFVGIWYGRRSAAFATAGGALFVGTGTTLGLAAWGVAVGLLMFTACLVAPVRRERRAPAPAEES